MSGPNHRGPSTRRAFRPGFACETVPPAAYILDPAAKLAYYGLRPHLSTSLDGVILGHELDAADEPETELAPELAPRLFGIGLGGHNDWGPASQAELRAAGGAAGP